MRHFLIKVSLYPSIPVRWHIKYPIFCNANVRMYITISLYIFLLHKLSSAFLFSYLSVSLYTTKIFSTYYLTFDPPHLSRSPFPSPHSLSSLLLLLSPYPPFPLFFSSFSYSLALFLLHSRLSFTTSSYELT